VSGVLLTVTETTTKIDTESGPIYVCCQGCGEYFTKNRDQVIAKRNIELSPRS
jgi:hypothetical protein